jgi:hypothetical protein
LCALSQFVIKVSSSLVIPHTSFAIFAVIW